MKRRGLAILLLGMALMTLTSCSSTDRLQGFWYTEANGSRIEVTFTDSLMTWRTIEPDGSVATSTTEYTLTRGVITTQSGKYKFDRLCYINQGMLVLGGFRFKRAE